MNVRDSPESGGKVTRGGRGTLIEGDEVWVETDGMAGLPPQPAASSAMKVPTIRAATFVVIHHIQTSLMDFKSTFFWSTKSRQDDLDAFLAGRHRDGFKPAPDRSCNTHWLAAQ